MSEFENWRKLDGISFENAVGKLYQDQGYIIKTTQTSSDGGVDLILSKENEQIVVQCKCYAKNIGIAAVRELNGIKKEWPNANSFVLVGLNGFTKPARAFATEHNIELFSIKHDHFELP